MFTYADTWSNFMGISATNSILSVSIKLLNRMLTLDTESCPNFELLRQQRTESLISSPPFSEKDDAIVYELTRTTANNLTILRLVL